MKEQIKELDFLKKCSHKDLKKLTDCLIYGVGDHKHRRWAQELSENQAYIDNKETKSLQNAVDKIIDEFLRCGSSTINNKIRDGGVPYSEILRDICNRLYIYHYKGMPVTMIEKYLITYLMECCLISNPEIVNDLYSKWCDNEELTIYQSNDPSQEFKMDCIMDFCLAKSLSIIDIINTINQVRHSLLFFTNIYQAMLMESVSLFPLMR